MESFLSVSTTSSQPSPPSEPPKKKKGRPPKIKLEHEIKNLTLNDQNNNHDQNTNQQTSTNESIYGPPPEKVKQKRGRKKKERPVEEEVKVKKKRGRKAALKFYSSSIRKKIPINTEYHNNETIILHLDADSKQTKEINQDYTVEDNEQKTELYNFNQKDKEDYDDDDDILETYLNEKDTDPTVTLKTLYDQKIEQRTKQDTEFLGKLNSIEYTEEDIDQLDADSETPKKTSVLTVEDQREKDVKNGYITVLYKMVENDHWLDKVNIRCWWCCHYFDDVPLGLPIKYKEDTKKFLVKGCFCSIGCLLAYHKSSSRKLSDSVNSYSLIKFMYTKLYGKSIFDTLTPSPPRESLIDFGGTLTIDEFRNSSSNGKLYKMIDYPMIVVRDFIEEIDLNLLKEKNNNRISSKTRLTLKEDQIQEAKTRLSMLEVSNTSNTIDKFINFSKF